MIMTHGSLFSGIGGFDLAAEWMGWETVFQVEIDDFCNKVLEKHWSNAKRYKDIREFDGTEWNGRVDIISGGVPCQPASIAGQRKGEADDRWFWPEAIRIVSEIKPAFVVFENPTGLLSLENGKTFDQIFTYLENEGYTVESFIIPACSVGAWHRRDRIWIIANNNGWGWGTNKNGNISEKLLSNAFRNSNNQKIGNIFTDSQSKHKGRLSQRKEKKESRFMFGNKDVTNTTNTKTARYGENSREIYKITESERFNSISKNWWSVEPELGRVVHGVPNRVDRIKSLGNAVVPQVVFEIFKAIEQVNERISGIR